MDHVVGRTSVSLLALLISGQVFAVGLGELRGQPVLGEAIRLEVPLIGVDKRSIDTTCFRLIQSATADDLPSLRQANFRIRKGEEQMLEIRSEVPLREPVMQMTIKLGCGYDISRSYMLMASPPRDIQSPSGVYRNVSSGESDSAKPIERRPPRVRRPLPVVDEVPPRFEPKKSVKRAKSEQMRDRLILSGGSDDVGEPSLRLATELMSAAVAKESQRDILRLEYRMLMALNEQASSQLAAAEKLRNMEGALAELQARAGEFAQRIEKDGAPALLPPSASPAPAPVAAQPPVPQGQPIAKPQPKPVEPVASSGGSSWSLYGLFAGVVLGLAGWFGWRRYRDGKLDDGDDERVIAIPEMRVDPKREDEREELGGVDLQVEPAAMGMPMKVDFEIDAKEHQEPQIELASATKHPQQAPDSVMSINATTLDEHFEANPVMELADIMLSFGRVKGAAQALQEFIDHNPEEALQPWIRLMDVYRMAGMRGEFETVARNLNRHFNVEVQSWESGEPGGVRPQLLEDMPRLMNTVVNLWESGDVVGYLCQLLRDNRGGQRQGFALPVVDDILFLIELKETANRME